MILVYITCRDEKEAAKISRNLLDKKLIACSSIHSTRSMYLWNNSISDEKEFVIMAKTLEKNYAAVKEEVKKLHSYEIPCIIKIDADCNEDYAEWIGKVIK